MSLIWDTWLCKAFGRCTASQMTQALMRLEGLWEKEIEKDYLENSGKVIEGLNMASILLLIIGFSLTFLTLL